jgi:hypothetical protein
MLPLDANLFQLTMLAIPGDALLVSTFSVSNHTDRGVILKLAPLQALVNTC